MSENKFEIFKKINVGGLEKEQLIQRLSDSGIQFNKYANTLFEHPQFSPPSEVETVKLVKVTLSDLGLKDTCSAEEFSNRASALGLKICPLYLAAFLRLDYLSQPDGPYLTVASHKPNEDDNFPNGQEPMSLFLLLWMAKMSDIIDLKKKWNLRWKTEPRFMLLLLQGQRHQMTLRPRISVRRTQ